MNEHVFEKRCYGSSVHNTHTFAFIEEINAFTESRLQIRHPLLFPTERALGFGFCAFVCVSSNWFKRASAWDSASVSERIVGCFPLFLSAVSKITLVVTRGMAKSHSKEFKYGSLYHIVS
jgi:hypothetical protein